MRRKLISALLAAAGSVVIGYYVHRLGLHQLAEAFRTMGLGIVALLLAPLFLFSVHTLGWRQTLSVENRKKIGFFRLLSLQTFSYGIAGVVPMQALIAEPLKLAFLRGTHYDKEDFSASLLVDNTINGLAIATVAASGMVYLAVALVPGVLVKVVVGGVMLVTVGLFALAIRLQKRGLFAPVLGLLGRLPALAAFAARHRAGAERIDGHVRRFYSENRRGFYLAYLFHVLEKAHGVAEFWLIFNLLGMDVGLGTCFFIFSVVSTLDNLLSFAQVGGMETWVSGLLSWMDITRDSINITAALFRRVRLVFWALVALLLLGPIRRLLLAPPPAKKKGQ